MRCSARVAIGICVLLTAARADAQDSYQFAFVDGTIVEARYRHTEDRTVRTHGLVLDKDRLANWSFPVWTGERPDMRVYLLENGLASLANASAAPVAEQEAASRWSEKQLPAPEPTSQPTPSAPTEADATASPGPGIFERLGDALSTALAFLKAFWVYVVSALGLGVLVTLLSRHGPDMIAAVRRRLRSRKIDLIIVGPPGTGKTALYDRLRDPDLPESYFDRKYSPSQKEGEHLHAPIETRKFTFDVNLLDVPGSRSEHLLDKLLAKPRIGGHRIVLLLLAPFAVNEGAQTNEGFLSEQLGYAEMLAGVLRAKKVNPPTAVVVFAGKVDCFMSSNDLSQSFNVEYLRGFNKIIDVIESACKPKAIKFFKTSGSAVKGINTQNLLNIMVNAVRDGR